jgi:hypothetical protein
MAQQVNATALALQVPEVREQLTTAIGGIAAAMEAMRRGAEAAIEHGAIWTDLISPRGHGVWCGKKERQKSTDPTGAAYAAGFELAVRALQHKRGVPVTKADVEGALRALNGEGNDDDAAALKYVRAKGADRYMEIMRDAVWSAQDPDTFAHKGRRPDQTGGTTPATGKGSKGGKGANGTRAVTKTAITKDSDVVEILKLLQQFHGDKCPEAFGSNGIADDLIEKYREESAK